MFRIFFSIFFFFYLRDDRTTAAAAATTTSARLSWTPAGAARSPPPPLPPTSRLGREAELQAVVRSLGSRRPRRFPPAAFRPLVSTSPLPSSFHSRSKFHNYTYIYCFFFLAFFLDTPSRESPIPSRIFTLQTLSGNVRGHARAATKIAVPPSPLLGKHVHDSPNRRPSSPSLSFVPRRGKRIASVKGVCRKGDGITPSIPIEFLRLS